MKKIIIHPWSKQLRNGKENPKNYPWWPELIAELKTDYDITQIGVGAEKQLVDKYVSGAKLKELARMIEECSTWISIDSFLPHLASHTSKRGIVLWGQSDPKLFGYERNINLYKHKRYFRKDQANIWEACEYNAEAFVKPDVVITAVRSIV